MDDPTSTGWPVDGLCDTMMDEERADFVDGWVLVGRNSVGQFYQSLMNLFLYLCVGVCGGVCVCVCV